MGNTDTKLNFRKTIIQLGTKNQQIEANDEQFWEQFWTDHSTTIQDVFALIPASEIRTLRENNPANLATLCYKATERLVRCVDSSCRTQTEQQAGRALSL
ncbi:Protein HID1 [Pseudolycoriella hygida]|uniref:Protein HID1 n=1 Tax=Pseudolycoriella hygida TaxID=35572 RepID=A0A9Q0NA75_9DIPT|nr:Protein HID1 [Pseudolycoriella hygida]